MKRARPKSVGRLLGVHVSIAGGIAIAAERGFALGCSAIQIFTKNANQWRAKPLSELDAAAFRDACVARGIAIAIAHASYLPNLAAPRTALWKTSIRAIGDELARCALLGIPWLVVHPGAHMGAGEAEGIRRIVTALNVTLELPETRPVGILLEGTAGQGTSIGWRFEHLAALLEGVVSIERVGVCLDTCHLFAAGYDIRDEAGYARTMEEFDRVVGLGRIRAFHVNDSRCEFGSRVDRHAHIGQGAIGLDAFRILIGDQRFEACPYILETPKDGPGDAADRRNLKQMRLLVSPRS